MFRVKGLNRWTMLVIYAAVFAWAVNQYGIALSVVNGTSMQPTLQDGDRLLVNRFAFVLDQPKVGEVITFRDPSDHHRFLVKRVIGVPGDTIEIRNGQLYRNGKKVHEAYTDCPIEDGNFGPIRVKRGTVFVMGDNRHRYASRDSRYSSVGLVPDDLLDGKVELILWRPSLSASL
ncbi:MULTISPECIES: signal peptidase I [Thermoactinomyces]|jgi:signal peptidase I|uniref:Signal peptidase I n=1 Tax=Thermoactinomyces daqus TaxID=1329516 RepID=A0A7W2AIL1_9BACL|nr:MULTISPECIES: signal peptidase I [Thermoactinomyces]MBA4543375.1 signal peptidase I [Thermoactinomyces daqus]MBH8599471.1 signal peptidase I [Thermoactinomyces sp. CICC 10523]MBH8605259.1 signal peptidase I [Thermoactinomyces sp. CICC 10522]MBH8608158.1 signal peptidase I [Thermoactinomyces sp. CICC 10521]